MSYKSIAVTEYGSPDVLQVQENELRPPAKEELRLKVLACSVCRPDITVRRGEALYSNTPLGAKLPFVPGYAIIGEVDALGEGVTNTKVGDWVAALTVFDGYAEYYYLKEDKLIPVLDGLDPGEAVTLVLNYLVAYQVMHRAAKVRPETTALIIGASGGIGTAFLQLGKLMDMKMYGLASSSKHQAIAKMGAIPLDYHPEDYLSAILEAEPDGIDYVFDGMMTKTYVENGLSILKQDGVHVGYGEPDSLSTLFNIIAKLVQVNLNPDGKRLKLYGTSQYTFNKRPFLEDWAILFELLGKRQIEPVIAARFPILEAAEANRLLESGQVVGNIVLLAPDYL
jgi:NADPH:quinone reductase-like Zn-dependent oxidoreductase